MSTQWGLKRQLSNYTATSSANELQRRIGIQSNIKDGAFSLKYLPAKSRELFSQNASS